MHIILNICLKKEPQMFRHCIFGLLFNGMNERDKKWQALDIDWSVKIKFKNGRDTLARFWDIKQSWHIPISNITDIKHVESIPLWFMSYQERNY